LPSVVKSADAGLVSIRGHGLQINGQNFLVPVDLKLDDGAFTPFEMVKLDDVVEAISYTMVFGYCAGRLPRQPFANSLVKTRAVVAPASRGALPNRTVAGMLIAYSTQPNAVAADGTGATALFQPPHWVREWQVPDLKVGDSISPCRR